MIQIGLVDNNRIQVMPRPELRIKVKNNLTAQQLKKYAICHVKRYDVVISIANFSNPQLVLPVLDIDYYIDIFRPILKTDKQLILRVTENKDNESVYHGIVCDVLNPNFDYYNLTYWIDYGGYSVKNFYCLKIQSNTVFSYSPNDGGMKVFNNAHTLGFVTADRIPSLCEDCHYFQNMGSIRCAVNPNKCNGKVVFECTDFKKIKELVVI
jgi:hypothetical protein